MQLFLWLPIPLLASSTLVSERAKRFQGNENHGQAFLVQEAAKLRLENQRLTQQVTQLSELNKGIISESTRVKEQLEKHMELVDEYDRVNDDLREEIKQLKQKLAAYAQRDQEQEDMVAAFQEAFEQVKQENDDLWIDLDELAEKHDHLLQLICQAKSDTKLPKKLEEAVPCK